MLRACMRLCGPRSSRTPGGSRGRRLTRTGWSWPTRAPTGRDAMRRTSLGAARFPEFTSEISRSMPSRGSASVNMALADWYTRQHPERAKRQAIRTFDHLGFDVTIAPRGAT